MKTYLIVILLFSSSLALANNKPYGMAGCGFGSVIMGKKGNQILASTTNDTGTQTFGISSGTSNCITATEQTARIRNFIEANHESLITDMAKGNGDSVKSLSHLYGCDSDKFAHEMKTNYAVVADAKNDSTKVMVNINKVIEDSSDLSAHCTHAL